MLLGIHATDALRGATFVPVLALPEVAVGGIDSGAQLIEAGSLFVDLPHALGEVWPQLLAHVGAGVDLQGSEVSADVSEGESELFVRFDEIESVQGGGVVVPVAVAGAAG